MSHAKESAVLPLAPDDRTEFQLERLILFSDAVFAIAITLLVLEIRLPELPESATNADLRHAMRHVGPKFLSYIIGFVIIALFWTFHHRLFRYVRRYDNRLIFLNFLFLFAIAVMPFTVAVYGEHPKLSWGLAYYSLSVSGAGLALLLLTHYIRDPRRGFAAAHHHGHPELDIARPLILTVGFGVVAIGAMLLPMQQAQLLMMSVMIPLAAWNRWRLRKLQAAHAARQQAVQDAIKEV